jgi:hypothetical protein
MTSNNAKMGNGLQSHLSEIAIFYLPIRVFAQNSLE